MALVKILDPKASRSDDNASPGPDAGLLAGKRIGVRVDQIWRCWDWISEDWAANLRDAGCEVSFWRSTNRSGEEGEEQNRSLQAWLQTAPRQRAAAPAAPRRPETSDCWDRAGARA